MAACNQEVSRVGGSLAYRAYPSSSCELDNTEGATGAFSSDGPLLGYQRRMIPDLPGKKQRAMLLLI